MNYLKISKDVYNKKFVDYKILYTTMIKEIFKTEGHGCSFEQDNQFVGLDFEVVYTKDCYIDLKHHYSIEKLKDLINNKVIIII